MIFTYSSSTISLCLERANLPAHFISAAGSLKVFAEGMRPQLSPGARSWEEGISVEPPAGWLRKVPTPMANNGEIWGQAPCPFPTPSLYAQVTISREKMTSTWYTETLIKVKFSLKQGFSNCLWRKIRFFPLYFQSVTQWNLKYRGEGEITRKIKIFGILCKIQAPIFLRRFSRHQINFKLLPKFQPIYLQFLYLCCRPAQTGGRQSPPPGLRLSLLQKEQGLRTAALFSFSFSVPTYLFFVKEISNWL